jgi:hypothetical protein
MNLDLLRAYISEYERNFVAISDQEIYKWRAVKQFQDNWDPDAEDFAGMLKSSLSGTRNLLGSGNYFPRSMMKKNATINPTEMKAAFLALFDEDGDLRERIPSFQARIKGLNSREFGDDKDYQDHRAVMVYLCLQYPDNYFFYKFTMFEKFVGVMGYSYVPKAGQLSTVIHYLHLCESIREELLLNNNLLKLHKERIGEKEYFDAGFTILTQDFIYAVTKYLKPSQPILSKDEPKLRIWTLKPGPLKKEGKESFAGRHTDFISQQRRNKKIGDKGEDLVLAYERKRCSPKYRDKIIHVSRSEGDGLGYDILSFDEAGNEKFIEVKTTTRDDDKTPFFLSRAELDRSKQKGNRYFLYRLYNFDEASETADCFILQGDLSEYCVNPIQYEILLGKDQVEPLDLI